MLVACLDARDGRRVEGFFPEFGLQGGFASAKRLGCL